MTFISFRKDVGLPQSLKWRKKKPEEYIQNLLSLPNDGANPSTEMGSLRQAVNHALQKRDSMVQTEKTPELWTEFLVACGSIIQKNRFIHDVILANHLACMIMHGVTNLTAVAHNEDFSSTHPPTGFRGFLPALQSEVLSLDSMDTLLSNERIASNSRLWITRKPTAVGEMCPS